MAESRMRLGSIPPRLRDDNSGLKATPRRGLAEVRNTPLPSATADKKSTRAFGGNTPSRLDGALSSMRKTSNALQIYEDPEQSKVSAESVAKMTMDVLEEEIDTCERDPSKDEETLEDFIMEREKEIPSLVEGDLSISHWKKDEESLEKAIEMEKEVSVEGEKTSLVDTVDDDLKTLVFGYEDADLSIYHYSSDDWSEDEDEEEEEEEESSGGVREYFDRSFNLSNDFENQWESLQLDAHDSDTEMESERGYGSIYQNTVIDYKMIW
ncbi:hypothetical protein PFISCL1PPCAC_23958 [Pristionchus fissidentatus]|uniref:RNA polymerase II nuclear localization protein SLC7A6OS n=1 Tax=Pristionchus fissidentatus TaxID=1538716 RepID=A0AAV5WNX9_9BILA|nr:hypothetical protein PFISCL1PPCAC_23958 [Pristionchus fissidentatus]